MTALQSKVTSKGQITLPMQLRRRLSIRAGDKLEFTLEKPDQISIRKKSTPGSSAGCGKRFLNPMQKSVTTEEMDSGIRQAMLEKFSQLKD